MISMLAADALLTEIWTIYFSANLDLGLVELETGDENCCNPTLTLISAVLITFLLYCPGGRGPRH